MTFPSSRFVWFEYVTKDVAKAQAFFGEIFNWTTKSMPAPGLPGNEYKMIAIGEQTIGGFLPTPPGAPAQSHWLSHMLVEDARATSAKVAAAGGKVLKEAITMGDQGTYAIVQDPGGAAFALWQPAKAEGNEFLGIPGAPCWNELYAADPAKSVAFYESVFGVKDEPMDMGPMGQYHVLNSGGKGRAGVMKTPMAGMPDVWMPYIQVADTDATLAKAKRQGAEVKMGPNDIPGVGKIAIFTDGQGGGIGILQPPPGM